MKWRRTRLNPQPEPPGAVEFPGGDGSAKDAAYVNLTYTPQAILNKPPTTNQPPGPPVAPKVLLAVVLLLALIGGGTYWFWPSGGSGAGAAAAPIPSAAVVVSPSAAPSSPATSGGGRTTAPTSAAAVTSPTWSPTPSPSTSAASPRPTPSPVTPPPTAGTPSARPATIAAKQGCTDPTSTVLSVSASHAANVTFILTRAGTVRTFGAKAAGGYWKASVTAADRVASGQWTVTARVIGPGGRAVSAATTLTVVGCKP